MGISKAANMKYAYACLKLGMPKDDVVKLLGKPDSQRIRNGIETYGWFNSEFKGFLRGGRIERRIMVELENNKVVGFDGENIGVTVI